MRESASSIVRKHQSRGQRGFTWFVSRLVAGILCVAASSCESTPRVMARPVTPTAHPTRLLVLLNDGFGIQDFFSQTAVGGVNQFGQEIALSNLMPELYVVQALPSALQGGTLPANQFALLRILPSVALAEPDFAIFTGEVPNVDLYTHQWGLSSEGARLPSGPSPRDSDINVEPVWDNFKGDPQFPVAVLDNGVYSDHPDLQGQDLEGLDFTNRKFPPLEDSMLAVHGTRIASIILGKGFGAVERHGTAGVAPEGKVVMLKIMGQDGGYLADALIGLNWVVGEGIRVSSNSWFTSHFSMILYEAIKAAGEKGHLFVTVAGNDGRVIKGDGVPSKNARIFPAGFGKELSNLVVVAAGAPDNALAEFSSWDPEVVHLAAPGSFVLSAMPPDDWSYAFGTSFAVPFVAGAVALALEAEESDGDSVTAADLTPEAIKEALIHSARGPLAPDGDRVPPKGTLDVRTFVSELVYP